MQMMFKGKKLVLSLVTSLALVSTSLIAKDIYATVDGENITKDDIAVVLRNPQVNFDTLPANTQEMVVNQLIEKQLLTKKAMASDVEKNPAFVTALKKIKKDLALEIWMQEEFKKINITEEQMKAYYTLNKAKFVTEEKLNARHILVASEKEAKDVIKTLNSAKDVKAKFIELAQTLSTGPTGKNGGSLGEFSPKQMVPEFSEAASALKKDTYTKTPVKTQFGYHVIYLEDKVTAKKLSYDEVKLKIKQVLVQDEFRNTIKAIVAKLKENAKIVIK